MVSEKRDGYWVVTGGAGFIGSHTVDALLARGERVVVLDDFSTGRRANLQQHRDRPGLKIVEINVEDGLWSPLATVEPEWGRVKAIIHLAAQTSVVASLESPLADIRTNYAGTTHVMEYARRCGVDRVVFASSAAVYGDVEELPTSETAARWPLSPYGVNKLASEQIMASYAANFSLSTVATRFFNVYGPRQDPSSPYSGVISIFIDRALKGMPLTIFGSGEQTRDFVYVGDVVRAVLAAADSRHLEGHHSLNVGTGRATSINELALEIVRICGRNSDVGHAPARSGEIAASLADVSRAKERLDFAAGTEIATGLERTIEWYRESR